MPGKNNPTPVQESEIWTGARNIVHFVGVCGAGKTTLSERLAARCQAFGGRATGTLDWDPHTTDSDRHSERAFSREFDRINNEGSDPAIHAKIVEHSLGLIAAWSRSDANLITIDRWYESYDDLPLECFNQIELALAKSGLHVTIVNLLVSPSFGTDASEAMRKRLAHTRANRPASWWTPDMGTLEDMVEAECAYQESYQVFCGRAPFARVLRLSTSEMAWPSYEDTIAGYLAQASQSVRQQGRPWAASRSGMSAPSSQPFNS